MNTLTKKPLTILLPMLFAVTYMLMTPLHAEETSQMITKRLASSNQEQTANENGQNAVNKSSSKQGYLTPDVLPTDQSTESFSQPQTITPSNVVAQHYIEDYSIYDATATLNSDYDQDGYHSTFTVSFDADTIWSSASVFADIYLINSQGHRELNFTTSEFVIYGDSYNDDYRVETTLHTGYPSDYYQVEIQLFTAGSLTHVATAIATTPNNQLDLPLEDEEHETPMPGSSGYLFDSVIEITSDFDHDGFSSSFILYADIDSHQNHDWVYGKILIEDNYGHWVTLATTELVYINGHTYEDEIEAEITLGAGYQAANYNISFELYSNDHLLLDSVHFQNADAVPLESEGFDRNHSSSSTHIEYQSSGSFNLFLFLSLLAFLAVRRWR